ncbi:Paclitaxel/taxanoid biosynthesis susceptibility protein TS1, partial [Bacillus pseudomycoides]
MRVFVKNLRGEPLMPCSPRKARLLLKQGKAKIIRYTPFTIQLQYAT